MDRTRFDALSRRLGAAGSRRSALGTVLGAALLGSGIGVDAKKKKRRRRNQNNQPLTCFGTDVCEFPSPGQDFADCDLSNTSMENCSGCDFRRADLADVDFEGGNYQGSSFREANLRGADLAFTDISGASFRDACLVAADFLDANTDGADFRDAILCNTTLSDGSIDNSGCDKLSDCCPPCLGVGDACGEGIDGDCCDTQCVNGFCESECSKDSDCSPDEFCCGNLCGNFCCFNSQCQLACVDGQCLDCIGPAGEPIPCDD